MWCHRKLLRSKWSDKVKNAEVQERLRKKLRLLKNNTKRRGRLVGLMSGHTGVAHTVIEGTVKSKNPREGGRLEYMKQVALEVGCRKYAKTKKLAEDRRGWYVASNGLITKEEEFLSFYIGLLYTDHG